MRFTVHRLQFTITLDRICENIFYWPPLTNITKSNCHLFFPDIYFSFRKQINRFDDSIEADRSMDTQPGLV